MKKRRYLLVLISLLLILFVSQALKPIVAEAAGDLYVIPSATGLEVVKNNKPMELSLDTLDVSYISGGSGCVWATDTWDGYDYKLLCVRVTDAMCESGFTITSSGSNGLAGLSFKNVGKIGDRSINAKVIVEQVSVRPAADGSTGGINSNHIFSILSLSNDGTGIKLLGTSLSYDNMQYGYYAEKKIKITTTFTYADTGEVVDQPFYQMQQDIDVGTKGISSGGSDYYLESWQGNSGYNGNIYVYDDYTTNIDMDTLTISAPGTNINTAGDDMYLKTGFFATMNAGTSSYTYTGGNCASVVEFYSGLGTPPDIPGFEKEADGDSYRVGDPISWTLKFGLNTLFADTFTYYESMTFTDTLPVGADYTNARLLHIKSGGNAEDVTLSYGTLNYEASTHTVTYELCDEILRDAEFYDGGILEFIIDGTVNSGAADANGLVNEAQLDIGNVTYTDRTEQPEVKRPRLSIRKCSDLVTCKKGDTVLYTVMVSQLEEDITAKNIEVTDRIPEGLKLCGKPSVSVTGGVNARVEEYTYGQPENTVYPNGYYRVRTDSLDAGGVITITFPCKVTGEVCGDITNTAAAAADDADEVQASTEITVYPTARILLTKRIAANDINWDNGNPTFLFCVNGTELNGDSRTLYRMVEFTKEYVESNTDSKGYVSMSCSFEDLAPGIYFASEEESARYVLDQISDIENGTEEGETVKFVFTDSLFKGSAVFVNTKYEWQDFSDSDNMINHVGR